MYGLGVNANFRSVYCLISLPCLLGIWDLLLISYWRKGASWMRVCRSSTKKERTVRGHFLSLSISFNCWVWYCLVSLYSAVYRVYMASMMILWAVSSSKVGVVDRFGIRISGIWYGDLILSGRPIASNIWVTCFHISCAWVDSQKIHWYEASITVFCARWVYMQNGGVITGVFVGLTALIFTWYSFATLPT